MNLASLGQSVLIQLQLASLFVMWSVVGKRRIERISIYL